MNLYEGVLSMIQIPFGIYGLVLLNDPVMKSFAKGSIDGGAQNVTLSEDEQMKIDIKMRKRDGFLDELETMAWLRLVYFIIVIALLILVCLVFACAFICQLNDAQKHISKIPLVNKFLSSKSRAFDPTKDSAQDSCPICMEEFATSKKEIAELNCSNKHIFHTECLQK